MLILLEMHLGFVIIVFLKKLLTMIGKVYQGEFFMHVSIEAFFKNQRD